MSTPMTAAQAAQDRNRDDGGRYKQKTHAEADNFTAPAAIGDAARDALPAGFVAALRSTVDEDYIDDQFVANPSSLSDMSRNISEVLDAINTANNAAGVQRQFTWTPGYDHRSDIIDDSGYLEDREGRITRHYTSDMADWGSTQGWEQVASIHEHVTALIDGPRPVMPDSSGSVTESTFPIVISDGRGVRMAEVYATEEARDAAIIEMATERWTDNPHGRGSAPATAAEAADFISIDEPDINLYTGADW